MIEHDFQFRVTIPASSVFKEEEGMQHFDGDFAEYVVHRIGDIPPDARPRWGDLNRDGLVEHFIWTMRHSMGRSRAVPFVGNCVTRYVARPLLLAGVLSLPKRPSRTARLLQRQGLRTREPGDLETLQALVEEYLGLVQADELEPAPHPTLGRLDIDGWDRFHVIHFEHHLKQFGM